MTPADANWPQQVSNIRTTDAVSSTVEPAIPFLLVVDGQRGLHTLAQRVTPSK
jgi:hypothetical protein